MSIRQYQKDHLQDTTSASTAANTIDHPPEIDDDLVYWTLHPTQSTLVDLREFAVCDVEKGRRLGTRNGPWRCRPELIAQLAPAFRAATIFLARPSVETHLTRLRSWWRLMDRVEDAAAESGTPIQAVKSVADLTYLHYDLAHRQQMRRQVFSSFMTLVNAVRITIGSSPLRWDAPVDDEPIRHLPPSDHCTALRLEIRRAWTQVLSGFSLKDRVREKSFTPSNAEEELLLENWLHFKSVSEVTGSPLPTTAQLREESSEKVYESLEGRTLAAMRSIANPTRWEVDAAYYQCLVFTGWNDATLLSLDAESHALLRSHPKDQQQFVLTDDTYELTGVKARSSNSEQYVFGLWKTSFGAGFIVKTWLERTAHLRAILKAQLAERRKEYAEARRSGRCSVDELTALFKEVARLRTGCHSVWLYLDRTGQINWLHDHSKEGHVDQREQITFVRLLIRKLNRERVATGLSAISEDITPSDFRDMFALYVYQRTGGNVLAVMKALGHKFLRTTTGYLDNNILNAESDEAIRSFLDHLFAELSNGRLDLTILKALVETGKVSEEMRARLQEYRSLMRSRHGIACRAPRNPPKGINEAGKAGSLCAEQACLRCFSNAIYLPESLSGIARRVEELRALEEALPLATWLRSTFKKELSNGIDVLTNFYDAVEVDAQRRRWRTEIRMGRHLVPGLVRGASVLEESL